MTRVLIEGVAWNRDINRISDYQRKCGKCKQIKDLNGFGKDKRTYSGICNICKECRSKIIPSARTKEARHQQYLKVKEKVREWGIVKRYGITLKQYNEMLVKQNYLCAICDKHQSESHKGLHVDHCHDTDKIRGLLCSSCNLAIGQLKHNITILTKAIKYLGS